MTIKLQFGCDICGKQTSSWMRKFFDRVDRIAAEWKIKKFFLVPFNHLSSAPDNIAREADWIHAYEAVTDELARRDCEFTALEYIQGYEHTLNISISEETGAVRNWKLGHSEGIDHNYVGVKYLLYSVVSVTSGLIRPAEKPEGIVPEPLRRATTHDHNKLETLNNCLFVAFQIEDGCSDRVVEMLYNFVLGELKRHGKTNVYIFPFAHLTLHGAPHEQSWILYKAIAEKFEQNTEITVARSNYGWQKRLAFHGVIVGSGRIVGEKALVHM